MARLATPIGLVTAGLALAAWAGLAGCVDRGADEIPGPARPDAPQDGRSMEPEPESQASAPELISVGGDIEAWLAAGLRRQAALGRIDLDLPIGMHLPLLASGSTGILTPRHVLEHTSHLGAQAYEDYLRAQPGVDSLTAQAFLVQLGLDDTPGQRPVHRPVDLDVMAWLVQALGGNRPLHDVLGEWFQADVRRADGPDGQAPTTPAIRAARELLVPAEVHAAVVREWHSSQGQPR